MAFVAGATGYTGRAVVHVLRDRGVTAIAHLRPDSPSLEWMRADFARVGAITDTTAWDPAAMRETVARIQPTHVFALLGITKARARERARAGAPPESYASVDYGLTALLLEATRLAAPGARFVYLSALGASESTRNPYLAARGRLERAIREAGMTALIVRPSFITGPDREEPRRAERIGASVVDRVLAVARSMGARSVRQRYRSRTAAELAHAMVTLALQPARGGVQVVDGVDLDTVMREV